MPVSVLQGFMKATGEQDRCAQRQSNSVENSSFEEGNKIHWWRLSTITFQISEFYSPRFSFHQQFLS